MPDLSRYQLQLFQWKTLECTFRVENKLVHQKLNNLNIVEQKFCGIT